MIKLIRATDGLLDLSAVRPFGLSKPQSNTVLLKQALVNFLNKRLEQTKQSACETLPV